jgi:hypothetical protein
MACSSVPSVEIDGVSHEELSHKNLTSDGNPGYKIIRYGNATTNEHHFLYRKGYSSLAMAENRFQVRRRLPMTS